MFFGQRIRFFERDWHFSFFLIHAASHPLSPINPNPNCSPVYVSSFLNSYFSKSNPRCEEKKISQWIFC
ncbi:hypothetical protein HanXRQr2_Chr02g0060961 [Helianthus annuus]|uniref:Uncharacterized protein n=1 Tax=Helianthus annuus TaxID=4232 RepID=A0A251VG54_HELAN|nr:hypothetical protein HanXRQr2_Chr02g0060961 [Helianthus annuus]